MRSSSIETYLAVGEGGQPGTAESWLARARALEPLVERYRDMAEQDRRLPGPLSDGLYEAGFQRMLLSKTFGGEQADVRSAVIAVEEVSRQDGSTGWNAAIMATAGLFADYFPEAAAREIFGGGTTFAAGSLAPGGTATSVPGGYRISGRWPFASGCHNANWVNGACVVIDDGTPRAASDGAPDLHLCFMPASEIEILDTWYTAGLRGTGSHDFQVVDVFVPEHRCVRVAPFFAGPPERPGVGYPRPFFDVATSKVAAVALGIARDAIDSFKELAATKTPMGGRSTLATQHTIQQRVGQAEALLGSARSYLLESADVLAEAVRRGERGPDDATAIVRLAAAHATQSAAEAVDLMYTAAGGTSIYATSRLERCFRDVHTVTQHAAVAPSNIEMVGQYLLGLGLQPRR